MSDREPTPRPAGRSGMSVSGTLSIIVAAVAVILGFLILRDINDDGNASGGGDDTTETTSSLPGGPNNTDPTGAEGSTTTAAPVVRQYTVIVANAAKVNGAAAAMTTALQGIGVSTVDGVNSNVAEAVATTTIYYNPTYEAEAADLAQKMGVTAPPAPMPAPPPLDEGASLGAANLLVQLGTDLAGKPLPAAGATTASSAPPSS